MSSKVWLGLAVGVAALAAVVTWARAPRGLASKSSLHLEYGPAGLQRVVYDGKVFSDLAQDPGDAFHIWHMAATDLTGKKLTAGEYGWGENNRGKRWDAGSKTWVYDFSWGSIRAQYEQAGDELNVKVTEENRAGSGVLFAGATVYPMTLHLPERPAGFAGDAPHLTDNLQDPPVTVAEYSSGTVAVLLPNETKPLYSGLEPSAKSGAGEAANAYAVTVSGVKPDSLADAPSVRPPLRPGESDSYTVSIRFAPAGTDTTKIAGDALRTWGQRWPPTLHWTDRRAIGTVFLASSPAIESDFADLGSNPRRYFTGQAGGEVSVKSPEALAAFQQRVLRQALAAAENLRRLNAQGVITWDIEGEEYPQNTSYVCSPDQIATVAPEMESLVADAASPFAGMKLDDAYFKILRDAAFRVGVCVRPQHFTKDPRGKARQVVLGKDAALEELIRKMRYAHERWGATLFYVDSTVDGSGKPLPATLLEGAAAALPDSLVIPEESALRMYRATAPFQSFLFHGDTGTPARVRAVYPAAFSVNLINDADAAKLAEHRDELTDAVRHGDVLMVHADYWQNNNDTVAAIYREAAGR